MRTPTHFSIGQEAVAVGVCAALRRDRRRLQRAPLPRALPRQGRRPCADGGGALRQGDGLRARPRRLRAPDDPDAGVIASSAILGQTMAVAVGSALAFTMDGQDRVAVTFFGDGTVEEGIFHETPQLRRGEASSPCSSCARTTATRRIRASDVRQPADVSIHARAASYGLPSAWWTATTSSRCTRPPGRRSSGLPDRARGRPFSSA